MTEQPGQSKGKNYDLIAVLYHSADNVESSKTYVQDGDRKLAGFFNGIFKSNLRATQQAQEMLMARGRS